MDPETQTQISSSSPEGNSSGSLKNLVSDFIKVFLIALAIIIPVRWFLFQPFVVTGDSMRPNFHDGDYLIIDEISYHLRVPARGEVIVMRFPNDPSQFFIKRIVGLPGERVLIENGHVTIFNSDNPQGLTLNESYLPNNNITYGNVDVRLDQEEYFVLGDNRFSSSDSRIWGTLPRKYIVGRYYLRLYSRQNRFRLEFFSDRSGKFNF